MMSQEQMMQYLYEHREAIKQLQELENKSTENAQDN